MALIFRLKKHELEDGSITYHPYVKVTISHLNKSKELTAVLDTGADLIYIPKDVAEYLNLQLSEKTLECKTPQEVFKYKTAKINIEISRPHEKYKMNFTVAVPLKKGDYDEVILGVEFLSQFKVTFDYANEKMILKKSGKKTNFWKMKKGKPSAKGFSE